MAFQDAPRPTAVDPVTDAVLQRLARIRPQWSGQTRLGEVLAATGFGGPSRVPGRTRVADAEDAPADVADRAAAGSPRVLLHAGPPFTGEIPDAIRHSLLQAILFEGWADDLAAADALLAAGQVRVLPAQDLDCVVPLAGVISPSMGLHVVTSEQTDRASYAAINEGMVHLLRVGTLDDQVVEHHRWLNGEFSDWLAERIDQLGSVDLFELLAAALTAGDDGHNRTVAGSTLIAGVLTSPAVDVSGPARPGADSSGAVADFLADAPAFALNLWMAACALVERAAEGSDTELITRVGGNGVDFGYQLARRPGQWITLTGEPPRGPVPAQFADAQPLAALGDSAVVDFFGLGGQALTGAPLTREALGRYLPADHAARAVALGGYRHPLLGVHSGISAASIRAAGAGPIVLLGMIERTGTHGRIGGGVYHPPVAGFRQSSGGAESSRDGALG